MTRYIRRLCTRRLRDSKGSTLVEAAILTPLLVFLTFAIVDFATIFYVYLALENGIGAASRYAITGNQANDPNNPGSQLTREDSIKKAMRDATPTLTLGDGAFTFNHLAVGGSTWLGGIGNENEIGKVTVQYTWDVMTPLMRPFFPNGQASLRVESAMKNEGRFN